MTQKFNFTPTSRQTSTLTLHPWLEIIKYRDADLVFMEFVNKFNYYDRPVITKDGHVLSHAADFLAARKNGIEEIEVVVIAGATQDDLIDFICFRNIIERGKNRRALYELTKILTRFIKETQKGKELRIQTKDRKTRTAVANLLGISPTTIAETKVVGDRNPQLLDDVDHDVIKNETAKLQVKTIALPVNIQSKQKHFRQSSKLQDSSEHEVDNRLRNLMFNIEGLGELSMTITPRGVKASIAGNTLKDITCLAVKEGFNEGNSDQKHTADVYTFQPEDDRFSIQISIRDIHNIVNNNKKAA